MAPASKAGHRQNGVVLPYRLLSVLLIAGGAVVTASAQQPRANGLPSEIEINGSERLMWTQSAGSSTEASSLIYVMFVDEAATVLDGVECAGERTDVGFDCSAPLPAMTPGSHTIELAAFYPANISGLGPHSLPLRVVRLSTNMPKLTSAGASGFVTTDGVRLISTVVATGLDEVTDLAALPDGRVLIAERHGRVRVFTDGRVLATPALTLSDTTTDAGGLLALAADPDFDRTRMVYALYTTRSGLRLARYAEGNGRLSARAILLDDLPAAQPRSTATMRIGPDRKIYVALDGYGDPSSQHDAGSYSSKILRLNLDGTTPDDQAAGPPIYTVGFWRPTSFAWSGDAHALWLSGSHAERDGLRLVAKSSDASRTTIARAYSFDEATGSLKLTSYQASAIPAFRGNVFMGATGGPGLLRMETEASGAPMRTEWLLLDDIDAIGAITTAHDGSIFLTHRDRLVQLVATIQ